MLRALIDLPVLGKQRTLFGQLPFIIYFLSRTIYMPSREVLMASTAYVVEKLDLQLRLLFNEHLDSHN